MLRFFKILPLPIFLWFWFASCNRLIPDAPPEDSILDGPVSGLNAAELSRHLRGDVEFNERIFTAETGLGPLFVSNSCMGCHAADGKGHPGSVLTRFGQTDSSGNPLLHLGAPLLQNRALPGYEPEQLPPGAVFARLLAPAITGLGYLEAVSDADILAMSDPLDKDGNGISGVANWIDLPGYLKPAQDKHTRGGKYLGRFGKKASVYNLLQQTVNAYNQDMGITSLYHPLDPYSLKETDPEVSLQTLEDVVFYLQTLKAPIQRNIGDEEVVKGKILFEQLGCSDCHKPQLKTGVSPIPALSEKVFYPYTDLLLHDMGTSLNDGYTEGTALPSEWRTPPLWGLGLSKASQGGSYFLLHDGRAKSIEEAIMYHGGEAAGRRLKYMQLEPAQKQQLLRFLESL